jgi:hypothetical protein
MNLFKKSIVCFLAIVQRSRAIAVRSLKSSEDVSFAEDLDCSDEERANTAKHSECDERQRPSKTEFVDAVFAITTETIFFNRTVLEAISESF